MTTAVFAGVIGFLGAYWLVRLRHRTAIRILTLLTVPALVPLILFGLSFLQFARLAGVSRTLFAVVLAHTVVFCPVALALCFYRCRQLHPDLDNAAREFGASELRILIEIIGLQMWRTILASMGIVFVLSWDEYIVSWFVTGFDKTYPVHVRNMLESTMSPEIYAAGLCVTAVSVVVVVVAMALLRRG
ncbi:MAG: ABC transporter permease subunit [Planctomycetes bacterium]|nr:ABC transporter permease subunit [Planctomycetota bacterium]